MRRILPTALIAFAAAIPPALPAQEPSDYTILVLEYTGIVDKPVAPVLISNVKRQLEFFRDHVKTPDNWELDDVYFVSPSFMDSLNSLAKAIPSNPAPRIALTIMTPNGSKTRRFNTGNAAALLQGFKGLCMQHPGLYAALSRFERNVLPPELITDL